MSDRHGNEYNPDFFFVLLPELRNQVYNYLLQDIEAGSGLIDYYQTATLKRDGLTNLLAFVRVCRQVRDELLSILVKRRTLRIYLRHVSAFLDSTLCHHFFSVSVPKETPFKIAIPLNGLQHSVTSMDTNIAPFLRLILARPNVELEFTGRWTKSIPRGMHPEISYAKMADLNRIFSADYREAWMSILETSISRVEISETKSAVDFNGYMLLFLRKGSRLQRLEDLGFDEGCLELDRRKWGTYEHMLVGVTEDI